MQDCGPQYWIKGGIEELPSVQIVLGSTHADDLR